MVISDNTDYNYRLNNQSLSHSYRDDRFEKQKLFFLKIEEITREYGVYDECEQRNLSTFIGWVRGCIRMEYQNSKNVGKREAYKRIKTICNDDLVKECFERFDDTKINISSRLNDFFIRNKFYPVIWITMFIKNHLGV